MSMSSLQQILQDPVISQAVRIGLNLAGMSVLVFGFYYRRYRDKELVTAAALFNVFIFAVLTILSSVNFSVAAGFGLFAILALFTLRSEPLSKNEMTYFFGAVAIAVITSVQGTTVPFAALAVSFVLAGAYVIDHPKILQSVSGAKVTLDKINTDLLADPAAMRAELSERLGVAVLSYQVLQLDYITEMARLNVYYRTR
jgi:predicted membrane protein